MDLPQAAHQGLRPGMFAQGEFKKGRTTGLTVPQTVLSLREGLSYVFKLTQQTGQIAKVSQVKVQLGQRTADGFVILAGLQAGDRLVASGASFLAEGDTVKVVKP